MSVLKKYKFTTQLTKSQAKVKTPSTVKCNAQKHVLERIYILQADINTGNWDSAAAIFNSEQGDFILCCRSRQETPLAAQT